jgi:hypothetical protein
VAPNLKLGSLLSSSSSLPGGRARYDLVEKTLGVRAEGFGFRVQGLGFGVQGLVFRVEDLKFRVKG